MQRAVHHHDRGDDIVLFVAAGFAEPRHVADPDIGHVPDFHRHAVGLRQDDIFDVFDVVALGQVLVAAAVEEADAADIDGLLAEIDRAAADIDVGVADRRDDLGQRHAVGVEFVQADLDFEFLGRAAPGIDLDDARHRQQTALHDPILDGAQVGQTEVRRAGHLIAVDFADQARSLNRGHRIARQVDVLLQADRRLRQREIIVDAVIERHPHERQAVERGRADDIDPGRGGEPDLHRDRIVALHLLGGEAAGLGGDLKDHRRRIGIGLDVELGEGNDPGADEDQQSQQDDRTPGQSELQHAFEHGLSLQSGADADAVASALLRNSAPSVATSSPTLHAFENLPVAVMDLADLDGSAVEAAAIGGDPHRHRTVALAHDAVGRHARGARRLTDRDDERGEHAGAQFVLRDR